MVPELGSRCYGSRTETGTVIPKVNVPKLKLELLWQEDNGTTLVQSSDIHCM